MIANQLWFRQPYQLEIRQQLLPPLTAGQVLVKTICSAISAGTEMLVYRGQLPADIAVDATLASLQQQATYPLPYGYACVGRVEQVADAADQAWLGQLVFSFQPHASHFIASPQQLLRLPADIEPEAAVFLANMETAVNLVLDGQPAIGERVLVLGQGIVGLLVSSLLVQFPLAALYAVDGIAQRRNWAMQLGVSQVVDAGSETEMAQLQRQLQLPIDLALTTNAGADLIFEVSGSPQALNSAIDLCSYSGRIVLGSWYGNKIATINLGGAAHRNRLKFISSQVSSIAPEITGRWDKARRFDTAWQMLRTVRPQQLISHRLPLEQAATIYQQLDTAPDSVMQAVFCY